MSTQRGTDNGANPAPDELHSTALHSTVLHSTALATVAFVDRHGKTRCLATRFHWNGSEIVICGDNDVAWSGASYQSVALSIGVTSGEDHSDPHVEVVGRAVVDRVIGCAPEYRAAAVRCLGTKRGNELSDEIPASATMHRMFISPCVEQTGSIDLRPRRRST